MVIDTDIRRRPGEAHGEGADESVHEVPDALVRGVPPFFDTPHALTLPLGGNRPLWYDGRSWRVGQAGWGDAYSDYVLEWHVLESLDTSQRHALVDTGRQVVLILVTESSDPSAR